VTAVVHAAARALASTARLVAVAAQAVADATQPTPNTVPVEWVAEYELEE